MRVNLYLNLINDLTNGLSRVFKTGLRSLSLIKLGLSRRKIAKLSISLLVVMSFVLSYFTFTAVPDAKAIDFQDEPAPGKYSGAILPLTNIMNYDATETLYCSGENFIPTNFAGLDGAFDNCKTMQGYYDTSLKLLDVQNKISKGYQTDAYEKEHEDLNFQYANTGIILKPLVKNAVNEENPTYEGSTVLEFSETTDEAMRFDLRDSYEYQETLLMYQSLSYETLKQMLLKFIEINDDAYNVLNLSKRDRSDVRTQRDNWEVDSWFSFCADEATVLAGGNVNYCEDLYAYYMLNTDYGQARLDAEVAKAQDRGSDIAGNQEETIERKRIILAQNIARFMSGAEASCLRMSTLHLEATERYANFYKAKQVMINAFTDSNYSIAEMTDAEIETLSKVGYDASSMKSLRLTASENLVAQPTRSNHLIAYSSDGKQMVNSKQADCIYSYSMVPTNDSHACVGTVDDEKFKNPEFTGSGKTALGVDANVTLFNPNTEYDSADLGSIIRNRDDSVSVKSLKFEASTSPMDYLKDITINKSHLPAPLAQSGLSYRYQVEDGGEAIVAVEQETQHRTRTWLYNGESTPTHNPVSIYVKNISCGSGGVALFIKTQVIWFDKDKRIIDQSPVDKYGSCGASHTIVQRNVDAAYFTVMGNNDGTVTSLCTGNTDDTIPHGFTCEPDRVKIDNNMWSGNGHYYPVAKVYPGANYRVSAGGSDGGKNWTVGIVKPGEGYAIRGRVKPTLTLSIGSSCAPAYLKWYAYDSNYKEIGHGDDNANDNTEAGYENGDQIKIGGADCFGNRYAYAELPERTEYVRLYAGHSGHTLDEWCSGAWDGRHSGDDGSRYGKNGDVKSNEIFWGDLCKDVAGNYNDKDFSHGRIRWAHNGSKHFPENYDYIKMPPTLEIHVATKDSDSWSSFSENMWDGYDIDAWAGGTMPAHSPMIGFLACTVGSLGAYFVPTYEINSGTTKVKGQDCEYATMPKVSNVYEKVNSLVLNFMPRQYFEFRSAQNGAWTGSVTPYNQTTCSTSPTHCNWTGVNTATMGTATFGAIPLQNITGGLGNEALRLLSQNEIIREANGFNLLSPYTQLSNIINVSGTLYSAEGINNIYPEGQFKNTELKYVRGDVIDNPYENNDVLMTKEARNSGTFNVKDSPNYGDFSGTGSLTVMSNKGMAVTSDNSSTCSDKVYGCDAIFANSKIPVHATTHSEGNDDKYPVADPSNMNFLLDVMQEKCQNHNLNGNTYDCTNVKKDGDSWGEANKEIEKRTRDAFKNFDPYGKPVLGYQYYTGNSYKFKTSFDKNSIDVKELENQGRNLQDISFMSTGAVLTKASFVLDGVFSDNFSVYYRVYQCPTNNDSSCEWSGIGANGNLAGDGFSPVLAMQVYTVPKNFARGGAIATIKGFGVTYNENSATLIEPNVLYTDSTFSKWTTVRCNWPQAVATNNFYENVSDCGNIPVGSYVKIVVAKLSGFEYVMPTNGDAYSELFYYDGDSQMFAGVFYDGKFMHTVMYTRLVDDDDSSGKSEAAGGKKVWGEFVKQQKNSIATKALTIISMVITLALSIVGIAMMVAAATAAAAAAAAAGSMLVINIALAITTFAVTVIFMSLQVDSAGKTNASLLAYRDIHEKECNKLDDQVECFPVISSFFWVNHGYYNSGEVKMHYDFLERGSDGELNRVVGVTNIYEGHHQEGSNFAVQLSNQRILVRRTGLEYENIFPPDGARVWFEVDGEEKSGQKFILIANSNMAAGYMSTGQDISKHCGLYAYAEYLTVRTFMRIQQEEAFSARVDMDMAISQLVVSIAIPIIGVAAKPVGAFFGSVFRAAKEAFLGWLRGLRSNQESVTSVAEAQLPDSVRGVSFENPNSVLAELDSQGRRVMHTSDAFDSSSQSAVDIHPSEALAAEGQRPVAQGRALGVAAAAREEEPIRLAEMMGENDGQPEVGPEGEVVRGIDAAMGREAGPGGVAEQVARGEALVAAAEGEGGAGPQRPAPVGERVLSEAERLRNHHFIANQRNHLEIAVRDMHQEAENLQKIGNGNRGGDRTIVNQRLFGRIRAWQLELLEAFEDSQQRGIFDENDFAGIIRQAQDVLDGLVRKCDELFSQSMEEYNTVSEAYKLKTLTPEQRQETLKTLSGLRDTADGFRHLRVYYRQLRVFLERMNHEDLATMGAGSNLIEMIDRLMCPFEGSENGFVMPENVLEGFENWLEVVEYRYRLQRPRGLGNRLPQGVSVYRHRLNAVIAYGNELADAEIGNFPYQRGQTLLELAERAAVPARAPAPAVAAVAEAEGGVAGRLGGEVPPPDRAVLGGSANESPGGSPAISEVPSGIDGDAVRGVAGAEPPPVGEPAPADLVNVVRGGAEVVEGRPAGGAAAAGDQQLAMAQQHVEEVAEAVQEVVGDGGVPANDARVVAEEGQVPAAELESPRRSQARIRFENFVRRNRVLIGIAGTTAMIDGLVTGALVVDQIVRSMGRSIQVYSNRDRVKYFPTESLALSYQAALCFIYGVDYEHYNQVNLETNEPIECLHQDAPPTLPNPETYSGDEQNSNDSDDSNTDDTNADDTNSDDDVDCSSIPEDGDGDGDEDVSVPAKCQWTQRYILDNIDARVLYLKACLKRDTSEDVRAKADCMDNALYEYMKGDDDGTIANGYLTFGATSEFKPTSTSEFTPTTSTSDLPAYAKPLLIGVKPSLAEQTKTIAECLRTYEHHFTGPNGFTETWLNVPDEPDVNCLSTDDNDDEGANNSWSVNNRLRYLLNPRNINLLAEVVSRVLKPDVGPDYLGGMHENNPTYKVMADRLEDARNGDQKYGDDAEKLLSQALLDFDDSEKVRLLVTVIHEYFSQFSFIFQNLPSFREWFLNLAKNFDELSPEQLSTLLTEFISNYSTTILPNGYTFGSSLSFQRIISDTGNQKDYYRGAVDYSTGIGVVTTGAKLRELPERNTECIPVKTTDNPNFPIIPPSQVLPSNQSIDDAEGTVCTYSYEEIFKAGSALLVNQEVYDKFILPFYDEGYTPQLQIERVIYIGNEAYLVLSGGERFVPELDEGNGHKRTGYIDFVDTDHNPMLQKLLFGDSESNGFYSGTDRLNVDKIFDLPVHKMLNIVWSDVKTIDEVKNKNLAFKCDTPLGNSVIHYKQEISCEINLVGLSNENPVRISTSREPMTVEVAFPKGFGFKTDFTGNFANVSTIADKESSTIDNEDYVKLTFPAGSYAFDENNRLKFKFQPKVNHSTASIYAIVNGSNPHFTNSLAQLVVLGDAKDYGDVQCDHFSQVDLTNIANQDYSKIDLNCYVANFTNSEQKFRVDMQNQLDDLEPQIVLTDFTVAPQNFASFKLSNQSLDQIRQDLYVQGYREEHVCPAGEITYGDAVAGYLPEGMTVPEGSLSPDDPNFQFVCFSPTNMTSSGQVAQLVTLPEYNLDTSFTLDVYKNRSHTYTCQKGDTLLDVSSMIKDGIPPNYEEMLYGCSVTDPELGDVEFPYQGSSEPETYVESPATDVYSCPEGGQLQDWGDTMVCMDYATGGHRYAVYTHTDAVEKTFYPHHVEELPLEPSYYPVNSRLVVDEGYWYDTVVAAGTSYDETTCPDPYVYQSYAGKMMCYYTIGTQEFVTTPTVVHHPDTSYFVKHDVTYHLELNRNPINFNNFIDLSDPVFEHLIDGDYVAVTCNNSIIDGLYEVSKDCQFQNNLPAQLQAKLHYMVERLADGEQFDLLKVDDSATYGSFVELPVDRASESVLDVKMQPNSQSGSTHVFKYILPSHLAVNSTVKIGLSHFVASDSVTRVTDQEGDFDEYMCLIGTSDLAKQSGKDSFAYGEDLKRKLSGSCIVEVDSKTFSYSPIMLKHSVGEQPTGTIDSAVTYHEFDTPQK